MSLHETGTFTGDLVEIGFSEADSGTPYVFTKWALETGAERTVNTYLSDASWEMGIKKLESIGFNGDFKNPDCDVTQTDLICTHEYYEAKDKDVERWEFANWGGGQNHKEASSDLIRKMNAKWKKSAPKSSTTSKDTQTPRERACEAFVNHKDRSEMEQSELVEMWEAMLESVITDKDEKKFSASDWKAIEDYAKLPF